MISHSPLGGIATASDYELLATCILPARLHGSTVTLVSHYDNISDIKGYASTLLASMRNRSISLPLRNSQ